jgi:hypothetical protein
MDNRINQVRKKISALRSDMLEVESVMHRQVAVDLDCSEAATRLMSLRAELGTLINERKALGDRTPVLALVPDVRKPRRR